MTMPLHQMTEWELHNFMTGLASDVRRKLPTDGAFVLLVFDNPGAAQYITNVQRADAIAALRETADRLQRKEDIPRW